MADIIGFLLFSSNIALAIGFILPLEAAIGSKYTQKGAVVSAQEVQDLLQLHLIHLAAGLLLAVQQMVSFKSQGETSAAAVGKDKKTK